MLIPAWKICLLVPIMVPGSLNVIILEDTVTRESVIESTQELYLKNSAMKSVMNYSKRTINGDPRFNVPAE